MGGKEVGGRGRWRGGRERTLISLLAPSTSMTTSLALHFSLHPPSPPSHRLSSSFCCCWEAHLRSGSFHYHNPLFPLLVAVLTHGYWCCSVLQCVAVCCSLLQFVVVCCSVLQCVAVCCSVFCSVLQCDALLLMRIFFFPLQFFQLLAAMRRKTGFALVSIHHIAIHCNTLQYSATHCNTTPVSMHHTATHCNAPQHTATNCNTLQHTAIQINDNATHCITLQHTATHRNAPQHHATHWNTLEHTATHCNTLQHTAIHTGVNSSKIRRATKIIHTGVNLIVLFFKILLGGKKIQ